MSTIDEQSSRDSILNHVVGSILHLQRSDALLHRVYVIPKGGDRQAPALSITSTTPLEVSDVLTLRAMVDHTSGEWRGEAREAGMHHENDEVRDLFHRCWGNASTSREYNKSDWNALAVVLKSAGYEV